MKKKILMCTAGIIALAALAVAQQPKSQKELDALVAIQSATSVDDRMKKAEDFVKNFADSDFRARVLLVAADSARQKGDSAKLEFFMEKALELDPKCYACLTILAGDIAQRTREHDLDKEEKLAKAEKMTKSAFEILAGPKPLAALPDAQWENDKKNVGSQAHENLGMIAALRKKYDVAIAEFKLSLEAGPEPSTSVRLAQAYIGAGKPDDALAVLNPLLATPDLNPAVKQHATLEKAKAEQAKTTKK
jgi:uncharacterized protein HemY